MTKTLFHKTIFGLSVLLTTGSTIAAPGTFLCNEAEAVSVYEQRVQAATRAQEQIQYEHDKTIGNPAIIDTANAVNYSCNDVVNNFATSIFGVGFITDIFSALNIDNTICQEYNNALRNIENRTGVSVGPFTNTRLTGTNFSNNPTANGRVSPQNQISSPPIGNSNGQRTNSSGDSLNAVF